MNCTVRFGKQFSESSPCLPGQQGTGQQGWYARGTLRKQFTKPTVQFILGRSRVLISCESVTVTRGGDGVHNSKDFSDVMNGWPQMDVSCEGKLRKDME